MRLLKLRQKAIRLADCSEFGWSLVAEYDTNDLADDSDDERKAEKAAERKAAIAKKKRGRSAQQSTGFGREAPSNRFPQGSRRMPEVVPVQATPVVLPGRQARSVSGACFYCGEFGHFRRNCPKAPGGAAAASK